MVVCAPRKGEDPVRFRVLAWKGKTMTQVKVQCKGSGQKLNAGMNAKRGLCPYCRKMQDLRPDGRLRKHLVFTKTKRLK